MADMLNTVSTINDYYKGAPHMHKSPMEQVLSERDFGIRPGTKIHKLTLEEEKEELKTLEEWDAIEEAEEAAV